jgi:hypothetical protein
MVQNCSWTLWRPCSFTPYTVSLVQWINCLLPAEKGSGSGPGMHPHLQWNEVLLLAMSHYTIFIYTYICSGLQTKLNGSELQLILQRFFFGRLLLYISMTSFKTACLCTYTSVLVHNALPHQFLPQNVLPQKVLLTKHPTYKTSFATKHPLLQNLLRYKMSSL